MKDFSLFEMEDLVMDEDFIRWVNAPVKADDIFWENWLKRNPHKQLIIAEARRIVESIGLEQPVTNPAVIDAEIDKLLKAININRIPRVNTGTIPVRRFAWKYIAAASSALVILVSSAMFFFGQE